MTTQSSIPPGTIIGDDFEIGGKLGQGGMGVVYAVRQLTTGYPRALKVMHVPFTVDARARARFEQEARICARIQSDHVVQVVASGIDRNTQVPWFAMEMLQGTDLERHIASHGRLPLHDVALITGQVGHALAAAHDVGVVHRDIKPENIFLTASRSVGVSYMVKVLDFGIAKLQSENRASTMAMGTPTFMAPEQAGSNGDIEPSADIWSMALVVFRMLTGKHYWLTENGYGNEPGSLQSLWRELLINPIEPASYRAAQLGLQGVIPTGFDEWFERCTDRHPQSRFQHARDAMHALDEVFNQVGLDIALSRPINSHEVASALSQLDKAGVRQPTPYAPTLARSAHVVELPRSMPSPAPVPHSQMAPALKKHRVVLREESERVVAVADEGKRLLDVSLEAGVPHYHACGGRARCSTCRVVVMEGAQNLSPRSPAEEQMAQRRNWPATTRLACQATVHGPVTAKRLVVDTRDAKVVDLRESAGAELRSTQSTVLAVRFHGIEAALTDGLPDDALHVLDRCLTVVGDLVHENAGRRIGIEGTVLLTAFPADPEGVRSAVRVALRAGARIRSVNEYLLKHFGVQSGISTGFGRGSFVEGKATISGKGTSVLLGAAVSDAVHAAWVAQPGQVLAPRAFVESAGLEDLVTRPGALDLTEIVNFSKDDVVFLVQSTFDLLGANALKFVEDFYAELFRIHPASQAMFEHVEWNRQRQMLLDTLAFAVRGLDDFAKISQTVRELGQRHDGYGVTLRDYQFVGRALLSTLRSTLGEKFTPEVEIAWREVYTTLVRTMTGT